MMLQLLRNRWFWLATGLVIVYIRGLFIPVMDVDASQYASISMEMFQGGSWLQVMHRHADYLDKPPLLFWLSAGSFSLFGIHTWAYKLPSLLGAFAGIYAVFRFTRLFYCPVAARNAAFMLASSLGLILITNDVRTDTLLLGMSAMSVWLLAEYVQQQRWIHLLGVGLFTGLAMLAKGPIGAILPVAAVGSHLLFTGQWRRIFDWKWLVALAVLALVLLPMCIGLYQQFDLHPEKTVNDRAGVSGVYFYFWEQSFGRITGENVWKNDTGPLYFTHVFAWAFLPWTILFLPALWTKIRHIFRRSDFTEAYSIGAFVLVFVALSMSKYKLPHYIFILLPWAAVMTAAWLQQRKCVIPEVWRSIHFVALLLAAVVAIAIPAWMFAPPQWWLWIPVGAFAITGLWKSLPFTPPAARMVRGGILIALLIGVVLNFHFYPKILAYQTTSTAGKYFKSKDLRADQLGVMGHSGHALDFYAQEIIPFYFTAEDAAAQAARTGTLWIYAREGGREQLDAAHIKYSVDTVFQHFQPALLNAKFLNPATRDSATTEVSILKIEAANILTE